MIIPDSQSPGAPPGASGRLEVGQAAPDFLIKKLDGSPVQLSSFKGKLLLLAFGSHTSPSFRQRVNALEELRRDYSVRANFVICYTREAHPAGVWDIERNVEADIVIADHKDELQRREVAKTARDRLRLGNFTFAIDTMDNAVATAYRAWPNSAAVLIGRDGTVLAYQQWFDGYAMREALVEALAGKSSASTTR